MSLSPSDSSTAENPDSPSSGPAPAPTPSPMTSTSRLFAPIPSSPPSSSATDASPSQPPAEGTTTWSSDPTADFGPGLDAPSGTPSNGRDVKLSKTGLKTAIGTGFRQACRLLAAFVADETERATGVWSPDAEDIEDVSRPAANIVYRRLPDEAKGGDAIDVIALGLALAAYVGKNLQWRAQVRAVQRLQEAQGIDVTAGETQA